MIITWPIAITLIGGIASICLTVLKIISMRKENKPVFDCDKCSKNNDDAHKHIGKILTDAKERLIVLETKFQDNKLVETEEFVEIKTQISKLTDIILEVLKKIKINGH